MQQSKKEKNQEKKYMYIATTQAEIEKWMKKDGTEATTQQKAMDALQKNKMLPTTR